MSVERLNAEGLAALDRALAAAPENRCGELVMFYAQAVDDYARIRSVWRGHCRSAATSRGSRDQLIAHPLLRELREARSHALELGAMLGLGDCGRPPGRPAGSGNPLAAIEQMLNGGDNDQ